ncbi:MAG: DUF4259 domain-containing protein [Planctomycetota bacterium]
MGTWGIKSFEDDVAVDWLEDLYDSDPEAFFRHCLDLTGHDYLEHMACIGIVCTAEMLHGLLLEPRAGLPDTAMEWFEQHRELDVQPFVPDAINGLNRVIGPQSEMTELWQDDGDRFGEWQAHIQDLIVRLQAVAPTP